MARLTRHEILKEDKFMLALEGIRDFFVSKSRQILIASGLAVVVALLVIGTVYYFAQRTEKAKDEVSQALKIYHAAVSTGAGTEQPPPGNSELSFKTAKEKYEKSLTEFQRLSSKYSSSSAGKIARFYSGLSLRELNRGAEAIATLEPLSKEKSDYGVLALVALAGLYESSGNLGKAAELYKQVVDSGSTIAPKNLNLMHLAKLYEQQNKSSEAAKIYQQLIKDSPGSAVFSEAEQRLKQISR